jgi:predicted nucleic acid-binding protein
MVSMKSAYELAMERLEKNAPSVALTLEQKAQIAEIDSTFKARIAERELFLKDQILKAEQAGNLDEAESLRKQLAIEVRRLEEDAESSKEKLRRSFEA